MADHSEPFDAGRQQLAAVYAKALLGAAEQAGQQEAVVDELESLLADVFDRLPQFEAVLATPRVSLEEKQAILGKAFSGRMSATLLNGLRVMAKHGRLDCVRAVAKTARKLLNEIQQRVEVEVRVAHPLSSEARTRIEARLVELTGKAVDLHELVLPDLVGGMVVRIGDTLYDGSVASQLDRLRETTLRRTEQTMRSSLDRFAAT